MATSMLFYVILVAGVATDETSGSSRRKFPLENCTKHTIDFLSLLEYDKEQTWKQQLYLVYHFFAELWHIVSNESILKRAEVLDQFATNNVTTDVREWKFKSLNHVWTPYAKWDEENGEMPANNISSVINLKIQFIKRLFREMSGVRRKKAIHAAVTFVSGENLTLEEISSIPFIIQNHSTPVKIFVVIFGNKLVKEVAYLTDMLVLPNMELARFHHHLLMAICNTCSKDWYKFQHIDSASSMSCYRLVEIVEFGWEEGMSHCSNQFNGFLAGFETLAEMEFFEQIVVEHRKMNNLTEKSDNYGLIWNIGLQRDSSNYAKRFRWVTSSTMYRPLLIRKWLPDKPSTWCVRKNCAIWKSTSKGRRDHNTTNMSQTISPETPWFVEGWEDVECRAQVTNVSLCEVNLPRRVQDMIMFSMKPAPNVSFEYALRKGHFRRFRGNIVSPSANVGNLAFLQNLRDSSEGLFPFFDCGEDAVDLRYISYSLVCDFVDHCSNGHDEISCLNPRESLENRPGKKHRNYCLSGQKLLNSRDKCDNIINCKDSSDEQSCFDHSCESVRCIDGSCLPRQGINDGEVDCLIYVNDSHHFNQTDESPLANAYLPKNSCALICNLSICTDSSSLNNTIIDCTGSKGPLDETFGKLEPANTCRNRLGNFIWAPRCHYIKDRYGGIIGCRDMSHLRDCKDIQCGEGYVKCYQSYCIPRQYLLDGKSDCPAGEDEQSFYTGPCNGNFACWGSTNCLHPDLVCNGYSDCPHNDDELDCDVQCPEMFRCIAGTATVLNYSIINPLKLSPLDRRTRYLDMTGITLVISGFSLFLKANVEVFFNLKVLILSNCSIRWLPENSFNFGYKRKLPFLIQKLDISYNHFIYFIHDDYTYYYKNINYLNISYNTHLKIIKNLRFRFLEIIDFSHTSISYLSQSVFAWLPKLKHLNLSHTLISDFSGQYFLWSFTLHTLDIMAIRTKDFHDYYFPGLKLARL